MAHLHVKTTNNGTRSASQKRSKRCISDVSDLAHKTCIAD
jgi:hypothetical protein